MKQSLNYYRSLPYSRRAEGIYENDGPPYWLVWIEELPGCKTDGSTYWEAMANLDIAFDDYIQAMLEFETDIPEPPKGKCQVREITRDEIPSEYIFMARPITEDQKEARATTDRAYFGDEEIGHALNEPEGVQV